MKRFHQKHQNMHEKHTNRANTGKEIFYELRRKAAYPIK